MPHNYIFKVRELKCTKKKKINKKESWARKITAEKVAGTTYKKGFLSFKHSNDFVQLQ